MRGPSVDTKGATNTECTVLVHTHDRGPQAASQQIDLSPFITQVTVNQHIDGGGMATVGLPAVDHIENIIAAGDIINIYFNTHRSDANAYNKGRVRTFFGYIASVTKSVSVGGQGEKLTTYTISCKDFSVAVRQTQIYNNEHLSSQGAGQKFGVVRADLGTNLGGVALLSRGFALQGTPRQIILQNLMRFLGFGGQWALPESYKERLPNSSHTFVKRGEGDERITVMASLQNVLIQVLNESDENIKKQFIDALLELSKIVTNSSGSSNVSQLWDAIYEGNSDVDPGVANKVKELQNRYKFLEYDLKPANMAYPGPSQINNTFFEIRGPDEDPGLGNFGGEQEVTEAQQGLKEDLNTVIRRVINEIEAVNSKAIKEGVGAFPKANLYAQKFDNLNNNTPVRTIFNLLCLDYLENVRGFWANVAMLNFQGSLWSALTKAANSEMNELFFDLRPSPLFKAPPGRLGGLLGGSKDGLGVELNGAIPMVPAVVLRRKPYTNYQLPNSKISDSDVDGNLVIGGFQSGVLGGLSDQLVINSGGSLGALGATALSGSEDETLKAQQLAAEASLKNISESVGPPPKLDIKTKTINAPTRRTRGGAPVADDLSEEAALAAWQKKMADLAASALAEGVNPNSDIVEMFRIKDNISPTSDQEIEYITSQGVWADVTIAKKALAAVITLPRPIFRSPDKNRITKEIDIQQTQYILGYLKKEGDNDKTTFFAFGGDPHGKMKIKSSTDAYDVGLDPTTGQAVPKAVVSFLGGGSFITNYALLMKGSSMQDINEKFSTARPDVSNDGSTEDMDWHVLDYMTIDPSEVLSESFSRGDFDVVNFLEFFGATMGGFEAQRLFLGTVMPIVTPISVYRFGVRVWTRTTEHVQALLSGATDHLYEKNVLLRWVILQDMWNQHNHELLGGSMGLKGMPGLRPGYRVDRLDLNLSFYVEQVSHSWSHPGIMTTQISVSRGQPYGAQNALRYERPTPSTPAHESERQELGKVFDTAKFKTGSALEGVPVLGAVADFIGLNETTIGVPGTYTGQSGVGKQLKVKTRANDPSAALPGVSSSENDNDG